MPCTMPCHAIKSCLSRSGPQHLILHGARLVAHMAWCSAHHASSQGLLAQFNQPGQWTGINVYTIPMMDMMRLPSWDDQNSAQVFGIDSDLQCMNWLVVCLHQQHYFEDQIRNLVTWWCSMIFRQPKTLNYSWPTIREWSLLRNHHMDRHGTNFRIFSSPT